MDIICTQSGIVNIIHPGQGIIDVTASGFKNILLDLSVFISPGELERQGEIGKKALWDGAEPLTVQYKRAGLHTPVVRAPFPMRNTKRTDLGEVLCSLALESIRCCHRAGGRYVIVRPLFSGVKRGEEWKVNREFYLCLEKEAKRQDVILLLENQCRDVNGHLVRGICSDGDEAAWWVDQLNREAGEVRFGFCADVGSCNLCGQNMREFILALGSRIEAVTLRDCDGYREHSMLPFTCSGFDRLGTDWLGLVRGMRETGFDGELILDFSDTAASFSPILRPQLMGLARATAEYFAWQIGMEDLLKKNKSIVLFGAGNMCRNYMKCYGDKCPPLFTCDNDRKRWGTEFCGLEIKSPESLREVPKDCVILICNMYYREIESQLRDMGIENRIEFFSDEFMPSFYFDRLEGR